MSYKDEIDYEIEMGERLAALSNDNNCRCPDQAHIWFENCPRWPSCHEHHEPPPDYCETCGGAVVSFQVTYIEDWRAALTASQSD